MTIKVETYYEVETKGGETIPSDIKTILSKAIWDSVPKKLSLKSDFWKGDLLVATKLSTQEVHEKIRTAK
jgi:hypothetical protein